MHVGGFGRTVGRSGSWVSTYPPPTTSYRTSIQAPSPHKPAHRFFPSCLAPTFFCGGSLCQQRLCRFHPRVYGDTRSPQSARPDPVNVSKQQIHLNQLTSPSKSPPIPFSHLILFEARHVQWFAGGYHGTSWIYVFTQILNHILDTK